MRGSQFFMIKMARGVTLLWTSVADKFKRRDFFGATPELVQRF